MVRPEPGAVNERPHHIDSIAHLFLEDDLQNNPATRHPEQETVVGEIAVACCGSSPISAFAAAGLALGATRSVTLAESNRLRWSAKSFLPKAAAPDRLRFAGDDSRRNFWSIFPEGRPLAEGVVRWRHLGALGPAELIHLESLASLHNMVGSRLAGADGLVWCLLARDAGRFNPSYVLGRLVEIIRPAQVGVLLFPDSWAAAGRPGWLEHITRGLFPNHEFGSLNGGKEMMSLACGRIPLSFHPVVGRDNLTDSFWGKRQPDSIWPKVGQLMMSPNNPW